jgi:hypothetical protein
VIARILIWNLFESKTTIDELRNALARLEQSSAWIWNEGSERFGLIAFDDELPEAAGWARDLIGGDPDIYDEFDVVDV